MWSPDWSRRRPRAVRARALCGSIVSASTSCALACSGWLDFFEQAGELRFSDRPISERCARPVVEQFERFLLPAGFVEQHGQAAVTLGVIRIALQALVVQVLGLLQIVRAVVERARFVQRRGQVVVAFGRVRVLSDRLLEAVGRLLVVALLVEPDAFDVGGLRLDVAAATGGGEIQHERGTNPAVG